MQSEDKRGWARKMRNFITIRWREAKSRREKKVEGANEKEKAEYEIKEEKDMNKNINKM